MKKFSVAAFCFAFAFSSVTFAQEEPVVNNRVDARKLSLGVYVAPILSWMRPTTNKTTDGEFAASNDGGKIGFMYGFMADYHFTPNYAFVTGLQVNMSGGNIFAERSGGKSAAAGSINSAAFEYNLQYLEIPVAIKMSTNSISGFRFFGQVGLTVGFNIAKKATYTVNYINSNGEPAEATGTREKISGTLAIAPAMLQMNLGLGTEYAFGGSLKGYVGIFFNNGFLPDVTNPAKYKMNYGSYFFKDGNVRLNNLALRIGIYF